MEYGVKAHCTAAWPACLIADTWAIKRKRRSTIIPVLLLLLSATLYIYIDRIFFFL